MNSLGAGAVPAVHWSHHQLDPLGDGTVEPLGPNEAWDLVGGATPDDRGRGWRLWDLGNGEFVQASMGHVEAQS